MNAIVLAFDRLPLASLGCYGNQQVSTPNFNRLAADAAVFDFHFGTCFGDRMRQELWWADSAASAGEDQLQNRLAAAGISTRFIVESHPNGRPSISNAIETNSMSELVSAAIPIFNECRDGQGTILLWLQALGLGSVAERPSDSASAEEQIVDLDRELGRLLDECASLPDDEQPLFVLTAVSGVGLHRRASFNEETFGLHEERIHTPLLIRDPTSQLLGSRFEDFAQPVDIPATLLDWFGVECAGVESQGKSLLPLLQGQMFEPREAVFCSMKLADADLCGIRTSEFYLVERVPHDNPADVESALFLKPDDIWDVNNVISQWPDVAAELAEKLDAFRSRD